MIDTKKIKTLIKWSPFFIAVFLIAIFMYGLTITPSTTVDSTDTVITTQNKFYTLYETEKAYFDQEFVNIKLINLGQSNKRNLQRVLMYVFLIVWGGGNFNQFTDNSYAMQSQFFYISFIIIYSLTATLYINCVFIIIDFIVWLGNKFRNLAFKD